MFHFGHGLGNIHLEIPGGPACQWVIAPSCEDTSPLSLGDVAEVDGEGEVFREETVPCRKPIAL